MSLKEDPHFEQIHTDLQEIQDSIEAFCFNSVFLRLPSGTKESQAPNKPPEALNTADALIKIETIKKKSEELEDRLKELQDNSNQFADQIEDYLNDLEDAQKTFNIMKKIVQPELTGSGQKDQNDVTWLTTYKNLLGTKMHKEHNQLFEITENEPKTKEESLEQLKRLDRLIATAGMLQNTSRYLIWFTNRVTEINDELPEYSRDFAVGLVAGWVKVEIAKVKEHEQNCFNVKHELESKLFN